MIVNPAKNQYLVEFINRIFSKNQILNGKQYIHQNNVDFDDLSDISQKSISYARNYPIFVTRLDKTRLEKFIGPYFDFLIQDEGFYINQILYETNIIDEQSFLILHNLNATIFDLAFALDAELSINMKIDIHTAYRISIISQFHFANISHDFTIYYAHSKHWYGTIQEKQALEKIQFHFPFARIINPADYNEEWNSKGLLESEIMDICLDIVSMVHIVIISPYDSEFISKGVHEEVKLAEHLKKTIYLLVNGIFYDYILGDINEKNWRNYCPYNYISLITGEVYYPNILDSLEVFLTTHKNNLLREIRDHKKKIITITETTNQSDFVIKLLHRMFSNVSLNILPILGKQNLCTNEHIDNICISHNKILNTTSYNFFTTFNNNLSENQHDRLVQLIKRSVPENLCPYATLYEHVRSANIIVLNRVFFKSIRLRTKLRQDILFDEPRDFILVFDRITDLFHDQTEGKCLDSQLREAVTILKQEDQSQDHERVISIIEKLLTLKKSEFLDVEYFLAEFLLQRHQKLEIDPDSLEAVYNICKTPFGQWTRQGNKIIQIIDSSSLKRFLKYFYQVYFLNTDQNHEQTQQGEWQNV